MWDITFGGVSQRNNIERQPEPVITLPFNERGTAEFTCKPGFIPDLREEVVIYDQDGITPIFGGIVHDRDVDGFYSAAQTRVTCVDWTWYFDRITVDSGALTGTITLKAVLEWFQTNYLDDYGFTLDPAQATGPSIAVTGFTWERMYVSDAFRDYVTPASGGWVFRVRPDKVWGFYDPSTVTTSAPFSIGNASAPVREPWRVTWTDSAADYATKIILVCGGTGTREKTETFEVDAQIIADGFYDTDCRSTPLNAPTATINGSPATIGGAGSQLIWSYNGGVNGVARVSAGTYTPTIGDDIAITYTAQFPFEVVADALETPPIVLTEQRDDITDRTTGQAVADGLLSQHYQQPKEIAIPTITPGLEPGQVIAIERSDRALAAQNALITEVAITLLTDDTWAYSAKAISGVYQGSPLDFWRGGGRGTGGGTTVSISYTGGVNPVVGEPITSLSVIAPQTGRIPYANGTDGFTSSSSLTFSGTTLSTGSLSLSANATIGGALGVTGAATFGGHVGTSSYSSQTTGWRITGAGGADFRSLYTDEMHAKAFIADLEQALAGKQIISKSVAILAEPFEVPDAGDNGTFTVRDLPSAPGMPVFEFGDWIVFREFSRADGELEIAECWGQVAYVGDNSDGTQDWLFARALSPFGGDMSGGTIIPAESVVLDFGASGQGYYEVNAIDGEYAKNSPYMQIVTWAGAPIIRTVQVRIGNLAGTHGYTAGTPIFGAVIGPSSGAHITIDPTNGIRIRNGSTTKIGLDSSGNAFFTEGALTLNSAGITITPSTTPQHGRAYRWTNDPNDTGEFGTYGWFQVSGATSEKTVRVQAINLDTAHSSRWARAQLFSQDNVSGTLISSLIDAGTFSGQPQVLLQASVGFSIYNITIRPGVLETTSNLQIRHSNLAGAGTVGVSVDASGNLSRSSDRRLKRDIADFRSGLDAVLALRPVTYRWTAESRMDTRDLNYGFVAQEVGEAIPGAAGPNPDGYWGYSDKAIIGALVNAVRELNQKVVALQMQRGGAS